MSRPSPKLLLAIVVALLALAACGGPGAPGNVATPTQDGVRPAPGGTVSGAEGTAEPDALATPTLTPTPIPAKTPRPVASVRARVNGIEDGIYAVAIFLDVPRLGLSGVDVSATVNGEEVAIEVVAAGAIVGNDAVLALERVDEDGAGARIAYARRGPSEPGDAEGEVATILVRAEDMGAIIGGLVVSLQFTDAGLTLHGPFNVPLD